MNVVGYNRFGNDLYEGPDVVTIFPDDFEVEDVKKFTLQMRGYIPEFCFVPKTFKDNFTETNLYKAIKQYFYIGTLLKTQFIFYDVY